MHKVKDNKNEIFLDKFKENYISEKYLSWLNNKELMQFSENRHTNHTIASCREYYISFKNSNNLLFAILDKKNMGHIGNINAFVDMKNLTADIGILGGGFSWLVYTDVFGAIWKCGTAPGRIIEPPEPVHISELDNMKKFPDASYTKFGDTWYYKVTPKDGQTFGETVTSCALPIINIPPEILDDIIIK